MVIYFDIKRKNKESINKSVGTIKIYKTQKSLILSKELGNDTKQLQKICQFC